MRLTMLDMISVKTIRRVDSPATLAASTKSRLRSESACPRRMRASTAQVVKPMISTSITGPPVLHERGDHDQQRQRRDDEKDVRDEVDDVVDQAAAVGGEEPEEDGDRRREDRGERPDRKRLARAPDDLREDVVALIGGAEEEVPARRLAGEADDVAWTVRREQGGEDGTADDRGEDRDSKP